MITYRGLQSLGKGSLARPVWTITLETHQTKDYFYTVKRDQQQPKVLGLAMADAPQAGGVIRRFINNHAPTRLTNPGYNILTTTRVMDPFALQRAQGEHLNAVRAGPVKLGAKAALPASAIAAAVALPNQNTVIPVFIVDTASTVPATGPPREFAIAEARVMLVQLMAASVST